MRPYSRTSKLLHWIIAAYICVMLITGNQISDAEFSFDLLEKFNQHKVAGLIALLLILWRLIERVRSGASFPGGSAPAWDDWLARGVHVAFYAAILAMPFTGWAASSAAGQDPVILGQIVPSIMPTNAALSDQLFQAHEIIGKTIIALFVLHMIGLAKRLIGGDTQVVDRMTG